jgi:hypothetical protein
LNPSTITTTAGTVYDSDHINLDHGKMALSVKEENTEKRLVYPRVQNTPLHQVIDDNKWYMATYVITDDTTFYMVVTVRQSVRHCKERGNLNRVSGGLIKIASVVPPSQ